MPELITWRAGVFRNRGFISPNWLDKQLPDRHWHYDCFLCRKPYGKETKHGNIVWKLGLSVGQNFHCYKNKLIFTSWMFTKILSWRKSFPGGHPSWREFWTLNTCDDNISLKKSAAGSVDKLSVIRNWESKTRPNAAMSSNEMKTRNIREIYILWLRCYLWQSYIDTSLANYNAV